MTRAAAAMDRPAVAGCRVVIVVQNLGFPQDPRVSAFATTLKSAGFSVEVIAPGRADQPPDETFDGIVVHRFAEPAGGRGTLGYAWEILKSLWGIARARGRLAKGGAGYILHICNPPDVLWVPFLLPPRASVMIYDQHDLVPELYLAKGGRVRSMQHRALLWMERLVFRMADVVLAPNASYARTAILRGRVAPSHVHIVRNAPRPESWFPVPQRSEIRGEADVVICYVGSIAYQDGVEDLVRAMAMLKQRKARPRYRCLVAGSGEAKDATERLAVSLGLHEDVQFLGWVASPERLREIVASADIAVEPCRSNPFNDASTMVKLMDYLVMGKSIVAYNLPEHRVTVGDAGVLVPPYTLAEGLADAIEQLAGDAARREALGAAAISRLSDAGLTFRDTQRALLDAYYDACNIAKARGLTW